MSTTTRITRADIIGGKFARVREVPVPEWDDATVVLWSLTEGQWATVEAMRVRGLNLSMNDSKDAMSSDKKTRDAALAEAMAGMSLDIEALTRADTDADAAAVAFSLSGGGETWSLEDVLMMRPPSVVGRLAAIVFELSGVTSEGISKIAEFRGVGRSDGDLLLDDAGDTARDDASGPNADSAPIPLGRSSDLPATVGSGEYSK